MATIKRGDTSRILTDTLKIDGAPIDLHGCSVVLVIQFPDGTSVRRVPTIVDESAGQVSYRFTAEDVAQPGDVLMEWEVTFADLGVLTVPDSNYIKLRIKPDLG